MIGDENAPSSSSGRSFPPIRLRYDETEVDDELAILEEEEEAGPSL
jgi:hypothetical protein